MQILAKGGARRLTSLVLILSAALLLFPEISLGLINPKYTPVDLVRGSAGIGAVSLIPVGEQARVRIADARFLKGSPDVPLALAVPAGLVEGLAEELGSEVSAAVLFYGDFKKAALSGVDDVAAIGAICTRAGWYGLVREPDGTGISLVEDTLDLRSVWAGDAGMLVSAVEEILQDPARAVIPARSGLKWDQIYVGPKLRPDVCGLLPVDFPGKGRHVFALSGSGDMLLRPAGKGEFIDVTKDLALKSASDCAAWQDMTGDGLLDLISARGNELEIHAGGDDRITSMGGIKLDGSAINVRAITSAGTIGRSVVCGTSAGIVHVWRQDGAWKSARLHGTGNGPCEAADFTGDGLEDVLQITGTNILLCAGSKTGFLPSTTACDGLKTDMLGEPVVGDYDGDGLLDLIATGLDGAEVFRNVGGKFVSLAAGSGEMRYVARPEIVSACAADINADGRQEFVLFYPDGGFLPFFSRGFFCFGFAAGLDLRSVGEDSADLVMSGQIAGLTADLDNDGIQETMVVTSDGILVTLQPVSISGKKPLSLQLVSKPVDGMPVTVTAKDRSFSYGSHKLYGAFPVFMGVRAKGPVDLTFHYPGDKLRNERAIVVRPTAVMSPLLEDGE